jgi:hypothetical protein
MVEGDPLPSTPARPPCTSGDRTMKRYDGDTSRLILVPPRLCHRVWLFALARWVFERRRHMDAFAGLLVYEWVDPSRQNRLCVSNRDWSRSSRSFKYRSVYENKVWDGRTRNGGEPASGYSVFPGQSVLSTGRLAGVKHFMMFATGRPGCRRARSPVRTLHQRSRRNSGVRSPIIFPQNGACVLIRASGSLIARESLVLNVVRKRGFEPRPDCSD